MSDLYIDILTTPLGEPNTGPKEGGKANSFPTEEGSTDVMTTAVHTL